MQATAAQEAHRPRLLFVDDEQRVLNSMRIMFRRQFELFLASHGAEALDIVRDKDIDVIVADHRMPKMTGVEVLAKVRAMSPRTVRILRRQIWVGLIVQALALATMVAITYRALDVRAETIQVDAGVR